MKVKALKFVRNNLELYGDIWIIKTYTFRPLFAILLCQSLNNRKFYLKELNKAKREFYDKINFKNK